MASYCKLLVWLLAISSVVATQKVVAQSTNYLRSEILKSDSLAYSIFLSEPDSSISIINAHLSAAIAAGDKQAEGFGYFVLSKAYWAKANFSRAAEFGFKALKVLENSEHITLWGKTLLAIGRTFIDLENLQHGKLYIDRAVALAEINNNSLLLAEAYRERSLLLSESKQYDSALIYADRGLQIFNALSDTLNASILFGRKAKIYFYKRDYLKSRYYNQLSLKYDSIVGNNRALGISYYQAALDAIHLNQIDSAVMLLKKSIPINRQIQNPSIQIKVHALLADIYREQKKHELAFEELKLANQYKDSLYNAEKSGQIQEMHSLYDVTSKEEKIQQLAQDNVLQLQILQTQRFFVAVLLLGIILLAAAVYFLVRYRRLLEKTNKELESKNRDIEQQKEEIESQAETLQQLNHLKLKLFSVISHDLRGPIGSLHSLLELLTRKKVTADEFTAISEKLKNNVDMTQRTLENLLSWSLSQMEGIKADRKIINIRSNIQEACRLMDVTAQSKNINIDKNIDDDLMVNADANQVQLILRNLIHNAIKFSKPSDRIFVTASRVQDRCLITVKDSGIGMSATELQTLKSSNEHFSKAGTQQERGTGLGLLLCKEFIKMNGGDIDIKSETDRGTEINFTLPLASN